MINKIIGADHEFHDQNYSQNWAERFNPTKERLALFQDIKNQIRVFSPTANKKNIPLIELGTGPGYLAQYLLENIPNLIYYGIDFSIPMLELAQKKLALYEARTHYLKDDLLQDDWMSNVQEPCQIIVTTWALHDLGAKQNTAKIYQNCAAYLKNGGLLLNGDFIKPVEAKHEYEPGRFEVAQHVKMLKEAGFREAESLCLYEKEINAPTSSQNYALLKAVF